MEIGLHVLKAVPLEKGGKGKKGVLSAYAQAIGKKQQYISQLRDGAEVWNVASETHKLTCDFNELNKKAQHLAAIHKADRSLWSLLVRYMLDKQWSAADTGKPSGTRIHAARISRRKRRSL